MSGTPRPWPVLILLLGCAALLRAQDKLPPPPVDTDTSPGHLALLAYKGGRYDDALKAVNDAEKARPGDVPTEILKARILTELRSFTDGAALLRKLIASGGGGDEARAALGDLYLRQRDFPDAVKTYGQCLAQKPDNPDLLLNVIYALIGTGDDVTAARYFSRLKPFDPDYPSYYFAKAALAQSTGKASEIDEDLVTVRTIYGNTTATRYLRTYLQVFSAGAKNPSPAEPPAGGAPAAAVKKT